MLWPEISFLVSDVNTVRPLQIQVSEETHHQLTIYAARKIPLPLGNTCIFLPKHVLIGK